MWSFGCIMAELYIGLPIFPGNSHYDQIYKIFNVLGFTLLHSEFLRTSICTLHLESTNFFLLMGNPFSLRLRKNMKTLGIILVRTIIQLFQSQGHILISSPSLFLRKFTGTLNIVSKVTSINWKISLTSLAIY